MPRISACCSVAGVASISSSAENGDASYSRMIVYSEPVRLAESIPGKIAAGKYASSSTIGSPLADRARSISCTWSPRLRTRRWRTSAVGRRVAAPKTCAPASTWIRRICSVKPGRLAWSNSNRGVATKLPPKRPRRRSMRPFASIELSACRNVIRLTPNTLAISTSAGSLSPGFNVRDTIKRSSQQPMRACAG